MKEDTKIWQELASLLFPDKTLTLDEIVSKYPPRSLPANARVTRIAPSPTGFMHIGGLYAALISERLAHQSGGVFFLRLEDTDKKREVVGAAELIVSSLAEYGIKTDEGLIASGENLIASIEGSTATQEQGVYGPYRQSERREIYQAFVKELVASGDAYPAFESAEELEALTAQQTAQKVAPGYYGSWAAWRDKSATEAIAALGAGKKPVIRLRSQGDSSRFLIVEDLFKGKLRLPENNQDIVILKSDGLPTYHFAHIIDDHFMGTTDVVRGDEWLPSLPLHLQLFARLGFAAPRFGHIAPIQKLDGSSRRKLSKRHDPEASISYYQEAGYPKEAVIMYLLNLANPSFEAWRLNDLTASWTDYPLSLEELKKGAGALLDLQKLDSISKDYIGALPTEKILQEATDWAKTHDKELADILKSERDYVAQILNIERTGEKARKDLAKWSDLRPQFSFFFDTLFAKKGINFSELEKFNKEDVRAVAERISASYEPNDDQDTWLEKMRSLSEELGFARDAKAFKTEPEKYKGNFADFAKILRVLLAGENKSPDLWATMRVMGKERVTQRLAVGRDI